MLEAKEITSLQTTSGISAGKAKLVEQIQEDGLLFIGTFGTIDFWQYTGVFNPDAGGAAEPLIRTEYVEYFSTSQRALDARKLMFGMMPDLLAIMEGQAVTERYLVSVPPKPDQGTYEGIIKTRPFPWLYRPDWLVSQKVV